MAALMGIASARDWYNFVKKGLLSPEVSDRYARQTQPRVSAEPITAAIAIPFVFLRPIVREVV